MESLWTKVRLSAGNMYRCWRRQEGLRARQHQRGSGGGSTEEQARGYHDGVFLKECCPTTTVLDPVQCVCVRDNMRIEPLVKGMHKLSVWAIMGRQVKVKDTYATATCVCVCVYQRQALYSLLGPHSVDCFHGFRFQGAGLAFDEGVRGDWCGQGRRRMSPEVTVASCNMVQRPTAFTLSHNPILFFFRSVSYRVTFWTKGLFPPLLFYTSLFPSLPSFSHSTTCERASQRNLPRTSPLPPFFFSSLFLFLTKSQVRRGDVQPYPFYIANARLNALSHAIPRRFRCFPSIKTVFGSFRFD